MSDSGGDHLSSAVGAGVQGVAFLRFQQMQAGGFRHFHDCRTVRQQAIADGNRASERIFHHSTHPLAFAGGKQGGYRAFATIRHRHADILRIGKDMGEAARNSLRGLLGR